jgi:GAF domain-containing protein
MDYARSPERLSDPMTGERGSAPVKTELHSPDFEYLKRTAKLLDEARALVIGAEKRAADRDSEFLKRTSDLETTIREIEEVLLRTEQQASRLTNLYVATYQLHASLDSSDVRAAIADIAVNLLGAETFTIWARNESGRLIRAPESSAHGNPSAEIGEYVGGDSLLDAAQEELKPQFGPASNSSCVAVVPFVAHGEVVGILAVHRFLAQKQAITTEDYELLDLMAAHAASALLAARAFGIAQRKLQTFEGLLGFLRRDSK